MDEGIGGEMMDGRSRGWKRKARGSGDARRSRVWAIPAGQCCRGGTGAHDMGRVGCEKLFTSLGGDDRVAEAKHARADLARDLLLVESGYDGGKHKVLQGLQRTCHWVSGDRPAGDMEWRTAERMGRPQQRTQP